ncbi:cytochrome bo3 quinol oxidase subunit 3 [Sphingomonas guangdongensis]|uniref:Cytochrome bo(3) ubiquinol oxidase subunit 3 n=1 Tax=Sphingomonas guangdongensis TaxID=1141890 RepID=A0A285QHJ2_9SPHN|nr:cytochrome o ubiquinol oxidase subunit III [Sphingomonas guangdongensis]SOB80944.1 cytochrome bo3 quinol oxidase subunit 3 [Sphingomonas guangdongensis]
MTDHPRGDATRPSFYLVEEDGHDHGDDHAGGGTIVGFWIYLMSDALIFATLFATYGVMSTSYAGGPTPREIFELPLVALNTAILLVSSITYGFAMIAMQEGRLNAVRLWLVVTALLGIGFVGVELFEFATLAHEGAVPQRSGFLSAFFTLVGTHGLHVTAGIVWIGVMLVQLAQRGLVAENQRRLMCLSMFWHFLDVIWIGVFTFVYLLGVVR